MRDLSRWWRPSTLSWSVEPRLTQHFNTYSSIDARRSDLLRLVEENHDRADFLHELQVHVEVLYEMTERMCQEMEKPEFELFAAQVGESIEEVESDS